MALLPLFFAVPAMAEESTDPMVVVVTTPGGDDSSYQIPLTTTITFDGVTYDSVYATTNSVITFGNPDGTYWDYPMTPSISLYSMDWVVYPDSRADEHLIISASDGGFQVDISARPIWLQDATEPTNINIVAAINADGTVSISYSLTGPTYEGYTRTGVRLTSGDVVTLEEYGVVQVEEPPVLEPEPVAPTPEPTIEPTPTPTPDPIPTPVIPEGATLLSEGSSIEVIAPEGQRIVSITAWYGDPNDATRGVEVSSTLTQLASGQTSVTIESSNIYGDPAPGTVKTLIFVVQYEDIPTPEPTPTPTPQPTVEPIPVQPEPTPEPTVEPTPEPTIEPTPEPEPSPEPAPEPTIKPVETVEPVVEEIIEPEKETPVKVEDPESLINNLTDISPEELTDAQVEQLIEAAEEVLATAEPGSEEYNEALYALAVAAESDDVELSAELAAIPLLGDIAGAALEIFNDLGNLGADMAPETRERAEETVIAAVIVGQIAQVATSAAVASAGVASAGSSGRKIK